MPHAKKQITLDLDEYMEDQAMLAHLSKPADGTELTEAEHQEATGLLFIRAMQNPGLFRSNDAEIQIGKYKAIFASTAEPDKGQLLLIKFVRA